MTCTSACIAPSPSNAHCGACHETFGSVSGFDRHRRGGECLNPATIPGIHRNERGVWRFDGGQQRADAHPRSSRAPQSDETGPLVPPGGSGSSDGLETISGGGA